MKQAKHSAGFRLHLMYTPTHAKPAPGHSRAMRAASLFLAAACLLMGLMPQGLLDLIREAVTL